MNIAIYMNNFDLLSYYAHYYNINILKYNNIDDDKCEIANDIFVNRLLNMNDYYIDILSSEYKKYNSLPMKTPILITYIKEHINESFVKNIIRVFIACIYKSKYHKIKFDKNDIIIIIKNGLQELITQVIA